MRKLPMTTTPEDDTDSKFDTDINKVTLSDGKNRGKNSQKRFILRGFPAPKAQFTAENPQDEEEKSR